MSKFGALLCDEALPMSEQGVVDVCEEKRHLHVVVDARLAQSPIVCELLDHSEVLRHED